MLQQKEEEIEFDKDYFQHGIRNSRETCISAYLNLIPEKVINKFGIQDGTGKKILDVGCGCGHLLQLFKDFGYEVYGLDISNYAIEVANKTIPDCKIMVHDCQEAFRFNTKFDIITCFEVLEHLPNPQKAIKNCYEAIKPNGIFIATTPNKLSPFNYLFNRDRTHINVKSNKEWKKILNSFKWLEVEYFTRQYVPIIWKFSGNFKFLDIPIIGYSIVVIAQK
jgi:2-polyprenyl-3-methyl-5-hydroxy-6-metoxy-1,4-benzoquinol methylase